MRRTVFALATSALLVGAMSGAGLAGGPRAADMDNPKDVFGGIYDNALTNAVPNADGVVTTPAGGGKSPLCKVTVTGLLPKTHYGVYADLDGGGPGPWVVLGDFDTNKGGNGQWRCEAPLGDGARVYVNDWSDGNKGTVLVSYEVNDL